MKNISSVVWWYLLIIIVSLFPLISIFDTTKLFHSHDGLVHLARIGAYFKALKDGEFPVRWAGDLNFGYGMPLFNFMYQVPYAIASGFVALGMGLVNAFKLTLSLSFILSAVFSFAFGKALIGDNKKAFLIAIFYQYAPFRLIELLTRGSFGEVYTYAFLPLVLLGIIRFTQKPTYYRFLLIPFATALLILSHNALSLVFFGVCLGFALLYSGKKKIFYLNALGLIGGMGLAAFYWMPALLEHKYTYGDLFMQDLYKSHFPAIQNLFIPNFTNDARFRVEGISVQIGLFQTIGILLSLILIWKKKVTGFMKKLFIGNFILLIITIFFMQKISMPIWEHVSVLRQFQFSWRFLGVVAFITSLFALSYTYISWFKNKYIYLLLVILTLLTTIYYWQPRLGYDAINESYYWNFPLTSTYYGETDVIWSAGPAKTYPKNRIQFIEGRGNITSFIKKTTTQTFTVQADTPSRLVSNTEYFPGWRAYVNGKQVPIEFQNPNYRGLITFPIPAGKSSVRLTFGETPLRFIADILSISSIIILFFIGTYIHKKK